MPRGHLLTLLSIGKVACSRCERVMDIDQFLATPVCITPGEWVEAALDYVEHAPELEAS